MKKEYYEKAKQLLFQMTLQEKIGQLCQKNIGDTSGLGEEKNLINEDAYDKIRQGRIGLILQPAWNMIDDIREAQRVAVEESRLKVPLLVHSDIIHGFDTIFPLPIASACSFNTELIRRSAAISATEATVAGINVTHAPMLDIARDPRWGRIAEGAGEDAYLAGEIAKAYVKGFQEDNGRSECLSATLKHFAGYGAAEAGRDYNTCELGERTMRNTYLRPFKAGIDAGAKLVMAGFHTVDSVPMTANAKYLRKILRKEFTFEGVVISDWCAPYELIAHGIAENEREAALSAFQGGIDVEMCSDCYDRFLNELITAGLIDEKTLDAAVLRILMLKFECGIMEDPYLFMRKSGACVLPPDHLQVAEKLADESIVLLKNENILPLKPGEKIIVTGSRCFDANLLGCWQSSRFITDTITYPQGLEKEGFHCHYASTAQELISDDCGTVIVFVGEAAENSGEACSEQDIRILEEDIELLRIAKENDKKTVCVVSTGRPMILTETEKYSDAIVYAWYLGHSAGKSLAGILSGRVNPSGKLCVTLPRDMGQIPIYYNHLPTGRPRSEADDNKFTSRYIDGSSEPLYPFGFGLSYSKFIYENLILDSDVIIDVPVKASITVENQSDTAGKETVQLYVHDVCAQISRPVKELAAFQKVYLNGRERKTITFEITEEMLAYYHSDNNFCCDPGLFEIYIGGDSETKIFKSLRKI